MGNDKLWVVVLAGGDAAGEPVPRQYCRIGRRTPPIRWAVDRALSLVPRGRVVVVVLEEHRRHWERELADLPPENVLVQPCDRGSAPGVLLPLLEVFFRSQRNAEILLLPADQYVAAEGVLRESLIGAVRATRAQDHPLVLLAMRAPGPEAGLGWILPLRGPERMGVAAFVEMPDAETAGYLIERGALVNSFILAGNASRLLSLYAAMLPKLLSSFVPLVLNGSPREALAALYAEIPSFGFSRDVLEGCPGALAVQVVPPCGWSDLETPARAVRVAALFEAELAARLVELHETRVVA